MTSDVGKRNIGVNFHRDGKAEVVVWSPFSQRVELCVDKKCTDLLKQEEGYWKLETAEIHQGDLYRFRLNGEKEYPDPASLSQPEGVHGPSQALDLQSFEWKDQAWNNPPIQDYIIYELHTGTFTPEGSFKGIENKLDDLVALGITAIEIMPVAQFPGGRNWGYDGVFPFAVQHSYGGATTLQELVDACHRKGIAVILDVVYNHLGPEGNYLGAFGPYTTDKYKTPWGGAINFDDAWCDGVRNYFMEHVLMCFRDLHIDALRLDAVHAIRDFSPEHILQAIRKKVDELMKQTGRHHYLIVEVDLNDPRYINQVSEGGYGMDAQWVDEFHHALRTATGGGRTGYYSDFDGVVHLAKAYRDAYVYDGQFSHHRNKKFGARTNNPGDQFIVFSQNHDQVGNRMLGERPGTLFGFEAQKLMAGAVMISPFLPMLFMGEEWGETNPFLYFVSHTDPDLAEAVRKGRKEEFAAFHAKGEAPDPMEEKTFLQSKLQWQLREEQPHSVLLEYYREWIRMRKTQTALKSFDRKQIHVEVNSAQSVIVIHRWSESQQLICWMNFSKKQQVVMPPSHVQHWQKLLDSAAPRWLGSRPAAEFITGGSPGTTVITLQPQAIVVYADKKNKN
jgi:maltooligosyltrehalose trehalohydrolase